LLAIAVAIAFGVVVPASAEDDQSSGDGYTKDVCTGAGGEVWEKKYPPFNGSFLCCSKGKGGEPWGDANCMKCSGRGPCEQCTGFGDRCEDYQRTSLPGGLSGPANDPAQSYQHRLGAAETPVACNCQTSQDHKAQCGQYGVCVSAAGNCAVSSGGSSVPDGVCMRIGTGPLKGTRREVKPQPDQPTRHTVRDHRSDTNPSGESKPGFVWVDDGKTPGHWERRRASDRR
jgi:hypothetical protein